MAYTFAVPDHVDEDFSECQDLAAAEPQRLRELRLASAPDHPRTAFSEYHAIYSASAVLMLRTERHKYVHYVNERPQLFDLVADPDEAVDVAEDAAHADLRADLERGLRAVVDPAAGDRRARDAEGRRIAAAGGADRIVALGDRVPCPPAPEAFTSTRSATGR